MSSSVNFTDPCFCQSAEDEKKRKKKSVVVVAVVVVVVQARRALTLLEPLSRFGDKPLKFQVVCPPKRDSGSKRVNADQPLLFF